MTTLTLRLFGCELFALEVRPEEPVTMFDSEETDQ